ncbi:MAG: hypothetical protein P8N76_13480 [Pirellulaceae bacterium]|nr:hypothetical protein [Pirellulaceae bacterium]
MSDRLDKSNLEFGQRIATYHGIRRTRLGPLMAAIVSAFAWVAGLSGQFSNPLSRLLLVVGFCSSALALVLLQRNRIPRKVDLHQQGLLITTGGHSNFFVWNQMRELYQAPVYGWHWLPFSKLTSAEPTHWTYRIVSRNGHRLRLDRYEGIRGLGRRIEDELSKRLLPLIKDSYDAGYMVRFGRRLVISSEGIQIGVRHLSWHQVADISIDEKNYVKIAELNRNIGWIRIPVGQVANLKVLVTLIDTICRSQTNGHRKRAPQFDEFGVEINPKPRIDGDQNLGNLIDAGYHGDETRESQDESSVHEEQLDHHKSSNNHRPKYPR